MTMAAVVVVVVFSIGGGVVGGAASAAATAAAAAALQGHKSMRQKFQIRRVVALIGTPRTKNRPCSCLNQLRGRVPAIDSLNIVVGLSG